MFDHLLESSILKSGQNIGVGKETGIIEINIEMKMHHNLSPELKNIKLW